MKSKIISLGSVLLSAVYLSAVEIPQSSLNVGPGIGKIQLFNSNGSFSIVKNGIKKEIESYDTAEILRKMQPKQLSNFIECKNNYIGIHAIKDTNNIIDYRLDTQCTLNGGGPWFGAITYVIATALSKVATLTGANAGIGGPMITECGVEMLTALATIVPTP